MLPLRVFSIVMRNFLSQNKVYLTTYLLVLIAMVALLFAFDQQTLHLILNAYHTPFLDGFFRCFSAFAEWPIYVIALCWAFRRYSWTIYFAISEALSASLVQVVKAIVNAPRPSVVFADNEAFNAIIVEGVKLNTWHSFPSGHTATFFVFASVLVYSLTYELPNRKSLTSILSLLCLAFALLGGFSRIYLSQHFLLDVCFGSLCGVLVPALLFPLFLRLDANPSLRRGLKK